MGEVYLAEDTRLDRKVALKPPEFIDGQRLRQQMASAQITLNVALDLTIQIAWALDLTIQIG
jgi:hypothetical protein